MQISSLSLMYDTWCTGGEKQGEDEGLGGDGRLRVI